MSLLKKFYNSVFRVDFIRFREGISEGLFRKTFNGRDDFLISIFLTLSNTVIEGLLFDHGAIKLLSLVIADLLVMKLCCWTKWKKKIPGMTIYLESSLLLSALLSYLRFYFFADMMIQLMLHKKYIYVLLDGSISIISKMGICILVCQMLNEKKVKVVRPKEWGNIILFSLTAMIFVEITNKVFFEMENRKGNLILLIIILGIVSINVIVYMFLHMLIDYRFVERKKQGIYQKLKVEAEKCKEFSDRYERQRKKIHEFNNHIYCISGLVKYKEYERLESYVEKLNNAIWEERNKIETGHAILNSILNQKNVECYKKDIFLKLDLEHTEELNCFGISDEDLVEIVSNVLNNAIEACEKGKQKYIELKIAITNNRFSIIEKNPFSVEPRRKDGVFLTTKEDLHREHGIGITNLKEKVEKNRGICKIFAGQGMFCVTIHIPKGTEESRKDLEK